MMPSLRKSVTLEQTDTWRKERRLLLHHASSSSHTHKQQQTITYTHTHIYTQAHHLKDVGHKGSKQGQGLRLLFLLGRGGAAPWAGR
jgi:hypothetical protein